MNRPSLHFISILSWLLAVVAYIYLQNNLYSTAFILLLLMVFQTLGIEILWKGLFKGWVILSGTFIVFYGIFLHRGDGVLFEIPGEIPLVSGIISISSILYGFFLGGSFTLALYVFSLTAEFTKNRRFKFYLPGILHNSTLLFSFLSHFTSLLFHHRKNFEQKIINRNLRLGAIQKFRLFLHDAFFNSLENSFEFAEVLESRGFSRSPKANESKNHGFLWLLIALLASFLIFRVSHQWYALLSVALMGFLVWTSYRQLKNSSAVSKLYDHSMSLQDATLIAFSLFFLALNFMVSHGQEGYLSSGKVSTYVRFDWQIHVVFVVHASMFIRALRRKPVMA